MFSHLIEMGSRYLVADIGGTYSRFAIFVDNKIEHQITFTSNSVRTFSELLENVKQLNLSSIESAVFAIAGPIVDAENINPPNIPWNISRSEITKILGIKKTKLINDFQAQALSILAMDKGLFKVIHQGIKKDNFPRAVIGAGTGFGKSLLVNLPSGQVISLASEGGHNDFTAINDLEFSFVQFAKEKFKQRSIVWDDVLSGRGLETIHSFITGQSLNASEISSGFLSEETETLKFFSAFYARAARHYVLDSLALGGLYIAGGVAGKNPLIVSSNSFRSSFLDSKYKEILSNVPLFLVESGDSGLIGAAYEAKHL